MNKVPCKAPSTGQRSTRSMIRLLVFMTPFTVLHFLAALFDSAEAPDNVLSRSRVHCTLYQNNAL